MRKRRNKIVGKHNKYIVYPMRGADITIEADGYRLYHEDDYTKIEFQNLCTVDKYTKINHIVATFNFGNIIGFERVD